MQQHASHRPRNDLGAETMPHANAGYVEVDTHACEEIYQLEEKRDIICAILLWQPQHYEDSEV